jgi:hypothetical protein
MVNCLDLNEDQLQIEKRVHDFVGKVIRRAAREWDEREETPWQGNRRMGERAGHSDGQATSASIPWSGGTGTR